VSIRSVFVLLAASVLAPAQWLHYPDPSIPHAKDGKPLLTAKTPRAKDGHPDLSGLWHPVASPMEKVKRYFTDGINGLGEDDPDVYFMNVLEDFKPGEITMTPAAAAIMRARGQSRGADSPANTCKPWGMPMVDTLPSPYKIVQNPGVTYILYEENMSHRQIFTDGRKHTPDPQPTWLGYSVGRWEGDTFVVDTTGFNDKSWLDAIGHPHSEDLHLTERFHRTTVGHMDLQITMDDPKSYNKPFGFQIGLYLIPDSDLIESFCAENEKDVQHLPAK